MASRYNLTRKSCSYPLSSHQIRNQHLLLASMDLNEKLASLTPLLSFCSQHHTKASSRWREDAYLFSYQNRYDNDSLKSILRINSFPLLNEFRTLDWVNIREEIREIEGLLTR